MVTEKPVIKSVHHYFNTRDNDDEEEEEGGRIEVNENFYSKCDQEERPHKKNE